MEITNISNIDSAQFINQDYTVKDESLLNSLNVSKEFGLPEDKVEVHIISPNRDIIDSIYDFRNYTTRQTYQDTSLFNQIELDPKSDLESFGLNQGQYDINYNFYRELFSSSLANKFYITDISSDRTEIKISTNNTSYTDLGQSYLNFIAERNSRAFYSDFILNFEDNKTYIGVNVALDNVNTSLPSLYIKLYEPLPPNIKLKDTFWIVESISEPFSFQVNTEFIAEAVSDTTSLRGPNVNIGLLEKTNLTTPYLNLSNLLSSDISSSYQQLQSWLEEKSIEITVDYNDFSNFVHFSSANERLENFKYKLTQIQNLQKDINNINNLNISSSLTFTTSSVINLQSQVDNLIQKFDGYEYFLYYESGSNCWPKTNNSKPYINYNVTSSISLNWFATQSSEAYNYDNSNRDYVWNNLPEYIREDTQNSNLELFVAMLGQHYDYIWTYVKDITDLQVADNRVDHGISKDLVADTLRNFGIKLYTNSRNQEDLYLSLLGINSNNSTLPSTGSLKINTYVTASQYTIPDNDIVKETYKRIYHNLPYLLKTKGTRRGLRSLINCFGIPETILKVKEYGGNKKDQDIIEQITPKFNYNLNIGSTASLAVPFQPSYKQFLSSSFNDIYPDTLEFRFKLNSLDQIPTRSLLESEGNYRVIRVLNTDSSYANLDFGLRNTSSKIIYSPPISLPLYNDDWWTLNLTRQTGSLRTSQTGSNNTYILTIGNKDSNGIQYLVSSSIFITGSSEATYNRYGWNFNDKNFPGGKNNQFIETPCLIQEFRYWIGSIPIDDFKDHILNPRSISYNGVTGSSNNLIFRLPLGSELDNLVTSSLSSVHPAVTASFISASVTSSIAIVNNYLSSSYDINYETFLVNTPNVGSITEIDEKVRIATPNLVPGDILTPYISIQKPEIFPITTDLNIVEVAISPQDSINADIIDQLGSFNIDDYIGDPRLDSSNTYPALTDLRNFYFKKYSKKENIFDLIKLLSYFDNSLFKMIKDFVPAKVNLSTGLVINTNILERNKIARHEPLLEKVDYSGSIETAFITGSNGLDLNLNTDFTSSIQYISGSITQYHTDKRELFTGELGGTVIIAHSQSKENIIYELNDLPLSSSQAINSNLYRIPLNPILNNVLQARTTPQYLDIDYAYNPIIPVNNSYLTGSLLSSFKDLYQFLDATVQDSNYTLYRHITPRYNGSKLIGTLYNTYIPGDISYGKDPVINLNSVKFAYFTEITSQSLTFPGRSNINLKYLIDSASNVTELTEANRNLFDVQDIFNRTDANIALENINQPSKQKSLNGLKSIYAGGFKYEPILQNYSNTNSAWSNIEFTFLDAIPIPNPATGSQITSSLTQGLIIDGPAFLTNPLSTNPNNTLFDTLYTNINSGIIFPVRRNTPSNVEVQQRVTGSVTLTIKIFPPSIDSPVILYSGFNYTGTQYPITETGEFTVFDLQIIGGYDHIASIKVPAGKTIFAWGYSNYTANKTMIGPSSASNETPFISGKYGFDGIRISITDTSASFSYSSPINNLQSGTNLVSYNTSSGTYPIIEDGLTINVTYPFDGLIILPKNAPSGQISLRNLDGIIGNIKQNFTFTKTSTSPQIRFTTSSLISILTTDVGSSFYYTQAPSKIYITSSYDNGFLSGSGTNASSSNNWYFERGNKIESGSQFTLMTASYDLSKLYYNLNTLGGEYYGNSIMQVLPTQSLLLGYQNITEYFNPKVGDLVRFFNHDSDKFLFSPIFEREITKIYPPNQIIGTGSNGTGSYEGRLVFEVAEYNSPDNTNPPDIPNQSCSNNPSGSTIGHILDFIILSKLPDETNIIINHEKNPGQTSAGMLIPENINKDLKDQAGNIIKNLKSQNLI
jgi:hypothetical protein